MMALNRLAARRRRIAWIAVVSLLSTASAATAGDDQYRARSDKIFEGAGNSAAHNIAVQTIDPWPPYVGNDRINVDGRRIQLGYRRYQHNRSIPPVGLTTSNFHYGTVNIGNGSGGDHGDSGSEAGDYAK
jgi:hypothetical protein